MQASRAFTRVVSAGSRTTKRHLHMTGPAPFSSLLTTNQPIALGSQARQAISLPIPDTIETGKPIRHFNTSRSLKSVGDSSTIDFMFIPDFDPDLNSAPLQVRVPLLPWSNPPEEFRAQAIETEEPVMLPTIHTVAADGTHIHAPSAMTDVSDSQHFDYQGMAAQVASKLAGEAEQSASMIKGILSGFVEDLTPKSSPVKA